MRGFALALLHMFSSRNCRWTSSSRRRANLRANEIWSCDLRANERPRKKSHEKGQTHRQTHRQTHGHRDSMKESAKGRFFENPAYGRRRISRPMRIVGPIQFWKNGKNHPKRKNSNMSRDMTKLAILPSTRGL